MGNTVKTTGSEVTTLDAANLAYEVERVRVNNPEVSNKEVLLEKVQDSNSKKAIPKNLDYLDDFYDPITGTSGTAFRDKDTDKVIVAYTGTNPNGDFIRDVATDVADIGVGTGMHYGSAYAFYEKIVERYGSEKVTLTGHSLGGNIAQRVALQYNARETIVYNAAPIYVPVGAVWGNKGIALITPIVGLITTISTFNNISDIENDKANFTGQIIRITTVKDPLNYYADRVGGVYIGKEYILKNSGGHGLDDIVNSKNQVDQVRSIITTNSVLGTVVSTTIQSVQNSLSTVAAKKKELKVNDNGGKAATNGLTSSEMIYLDSVQATIVASGLTTVTDATLARIKEQAETANQEAEDLYNELDDVPFYFILTPDEMKETYHEAGVHYKSIVETISSRCSDKTDKANTIAEEFTTLQTKIESGIATKVQEDADLAALFGITN